MNPLDLDYIDFVGLYYNLSRQDWREAAAVKRGVEMALGKGDLPLAYFDALAPDEITAEVMAWAENSRRFHAERLHKAPI